MHFPRKELGMTTAFQASIKYPLIWIINTANPSESEPSINKAHKKIKKMVRFTDWLRAHYETAYHYHLAEHLHEYGIGNGDIPEFLGLSVTGAKTLHISLYRNGYSLLPFPAYIFARNGMFFLISSKSESFFKATIIYSGEFS